MSLDPDLPADRTRAMKPEKGSTYVSGPLSSLGQRNRIPASSSNPPEYTLVDGYLQNSHFDELDLDSLADGSGPKSAAAR
jgi:hypothetical protein